MTRYRTIVADPVRDRFIEILTEAFGSPLFNPGDQERVIRETGDRLLAVDRDKPGDPVVTRVPPPPPGPPPPGLGLPETNEPGWHFFFWMVAVFVLIDVLVILVGWWPL